MALAASMLRSEMRRHLLMNLGLVATCVTGGTVVTNERGLFIPIAYNGVSETAKAFAAMFTPSHLGPDLHNVGMAAPLEPFNVTADSRDLRNRLMDAFNNFAAPANAYNDQLAQLSPNTLSPTELAGVDTPQQGTTGNPTATDSGTDAVSGPSSPFSQPPGLLVNPTGDIPPGVNPTNPGGGSTAPVPEPSMWAMLVAGFGAVGYMLRSAQRRRRAAAHDITA